MQTSALPIQTAALPKSEHTHTHTDLKREPTEGVGGEREIKIKRVSIATIGIVPKFEHCRSLNTTLAAIGGVVSLFQAAVAPSNA